MTVRWLRCVQAALRVHQRPRDSGNAVVEFIWLGILLLVPLVYLVLAVFDVQRASYGATEAAREAGRAFVTAPDSAHAIDAAIAAARIALADQMGQSAAADVAVALTCTDDTGTRLACGAGLVSGERVHVEVHAHVALPLVPSMGGRTAVTVSASHDEIVDEFRGGLQ